MKIKELREIVIGLAERNERGRLLLNESRIYGYLCSTGERLDGLNAEESAEKLIKEIATEPAHYEYEPGHLHLFC